MGKQQHKPSLEQFQKRFNYDPETGLITNLKTGKVYTPDASGYIHFGFMGYCCRAHRVAWFLTHGRWPAEQIDHINGDPGDNRLCNLREATNQQNLQNRRAHRDNKLGVKGVVAARGKFKAQLWNNGRFVLNRCYPTIEEASAAYQAKAREVFGEWHRP